MAPLVARVREFIEQCGDRAVECDAPWDAGSLRREFGFARKGQGAPEVIIGGDVFAELGHPGVESCAMLLLTGDAGLVRNGRITLVGPDVDEMKHGERRAFAQVVMLAVAPDGEPDPFALDNAQYLMHRLPGYMVRTVPGRLWARVSVSGRSAGLSLRTVGSALVAAYGEDFPDTAAAEVLFVTSGDEDVRAIAPVATEAEILAGRHKKLILGADGDVECEDLNCDACDQKPVCDNLRDVVIKRRSRKS